MNEKIEKALNPIVNLLAGMNDRLQDIENAIKNIKQV